MQEIHIGEAANDGLPPPEYQIIEGRGDAEKAIDRVLASATRRISIFDMNLTHRGFNGVERTETLRKFLAAGREHELRIVLQNVDKVVADAPRLINLLRLHPMKVRIHRTTAAAQHATDPLVIADAHSVWHQLHFERPRSVLHLYNLNDTAPLLQRFEEIWEASEVGVSSTTIGL